MRRRAIQSAASMARVAPGPDAEPDSLLLHPPIFLGERHRSACATLLTAQRRRVEDHMTAPEAREQNRSEWEPWLARLSRMRERARQMGGPERLERQMYADGKLDVRQRINALFDPRSFNELGSLVGNKDDLPADGFVCGFGRINRRP